MCLRPPTPDDAPAVVRVLAARDTADLGVSAVPPGGVQQDWRAGDLAADAVVADDPRAGIVGYALVRASRTIAVVHPDHERRGLGARLLAWAEERADAAGHRRRQWIGADNARARTLLLAAGYHGIGSWWRMGRALDGALEPPRVPAGVALRAVDPVADAAALHALDAEVFAANSEYEPMSLQVFRRDHLEPPGIDHGISRIAERDGVPVGLMLARRWDRAGHVDVLGVHPRERGRGLGAALLGAALTGFAEAGLPEAHLGVAADNAPARRLYERAGMRPRFRVDGYERR
jgi:mycothiol synthase